MSLMSSHCFHRAKRSGSSRRTRGIASVIALLFLIATVIFALAQVHQLLAGSVTDGAANSDSNAAFYLAESGLEAARAAIKISLDTGNVFNKASCEAISATSTSLTPSGSTNARGSFSYASAPPSGDACVAPSASASTFCDACNVVSTGKAGQAQREVQQAVSISNVQGTVCAASASKNCTNCKTFGTGSQKDVCLVTANPPTWNLDLTNRSPQPARAVFALAYDGQGCAAVKCTATGCLRQVEVGSNNCGTKSAVLQTNSVPIGANNTTGVPIFQTLSLSKDVVEVGALFVGKGSIQPTLAGPGPSNEGWASYWSSSGTVGANQNARTGSIVDGTLTATSPACSGPSDPSQTCTNWCQGGDTIVFTFAGNTSAIGDRLGKVWFATNGQNLEMTQVVNYPAAGVAGAPSGISTEIWWRKNENLPNLPTGVWSVNGLSSFKGVGTGSMGASWTSGGSDATAIAGTTFTVGTSFTSGVISAGDTVWAFDNRDRPLCGTTGFCGTIKAPILPTAGGAGTYEMQPGAIAVAKANNNAWTIRSKQLNFACSGPNSICAVASSGDSWGTSPTPPARGTLTRITPNQTGEQDGGTGRFTVSGIATYQPTSTPVYIGTAGTFSGPPSTTVYVQTASAAPLVADVSRIVNIKSAASTGVLPAGTKIDTTAAAAAAPSVNTSSFTLSPAPTKSLINATLCAGACALFAQQPSATNFSIELPAGAPSTALTGWAAGFTCMKDVDTVLPVRSLRSITARWLEVTK